MKSGKLPQISGPHSRCWHNQRPNKLSAVVQYNEPSLVIRFSGIFNRWRRNLLAKITHQTSSSPMERSMHNMDSTSSFPEKPALQQTSSPPGKGDCKMDLARQSPQKDTQGWIIMLIGKGTSNKSQQPVKTTDIKKPRSPM